MTFSVLDIISLIVIIIVALRVAFKGFVTEFMAKAGLFVGLIVALMFTSLIAPIVDERLQLGTWSNIVVFFVLFVAGFLMTKMLAITLTGVLEALHLSFLDTMLGFVLGAVEGAIIVSFLVFVLKLQTFIDLSAMFQESWVVALLEPIAPYSIDIVRENL